MQLTLLALFDVSAAVDIIDHEFCLIKQLEIILDQPDNFIRGHPFMTSTRRGVRLRWTHMDGGRESSPCGRLHRKLKLESTDVILSSSHARKLASFLPEFRLWTEKK